MRSEKQMMRSEKQMIKCYENNILFCWCVVACHTIHKQMMYGTVENIHTISECMMLKQSNFIFYLDNTNLLHYKYRWVLEYCFTGVFLGF